MADADYAFPQAMILVGLNLSTGAWTSHMEREEPNASISSAQVHEGLVRALGSEAWTPDPIQTACIIGRLVNDGLLEQFVVVRGQEYPDMLAVPDHLEGGPVLLSEVDLRYRLHPQERLAERARRILENAARIDPKVRFQALVSSGLIDAEGRLTKAYGGDADPVLPEEPFPPSSQPVTLGGRG